MARWSAVHSFVTQKMQVVSQTEDTLVIQWGWRDGRSQQVELRHREAYGRTFLHFRSPFGKAAELDAAALFRMNRELPFATIALDGDTWYIVYNALLEHLSMDEVEFCLVRVATVADALEERFLGQDVH